MSAAARHREHKESDAAEERAARHIEAEAGLVEREAEALERETEAYARSLVVEKLVEELEETLEADPSGADPHADDGRKHRHAPEAKAADHEEAEAREVEEDAKALAHATRHREKHLRKHIGRKEYEAEGLAEEKEAKAFSAETARGPDRDADTMLNEEGEATEREATGLELDVLDLELDRMKASDTLIEAVETFVEAEDEKADESDAAEKPDDGGADGEVPGGEPAEDAGARPAPKRKSAAKSRTSRSKP